MAEPAPRQLMTCPYNMAHQVEHYRMQVHLEKCRKQYPNCGKATCPFDARHIVNDAELDFHTLECKKRAMMDTQLFVMDHDHRPPAPVPPPPPADCEENWEEVETTSYIPDPTRNGPHVIHKIRGATPAERRKARMEGIRTYKPPE